MYFKLNIQTNIQSLLNANNWEEKKKGVGKCPTFENLSNYKFCGFSFRNGNAKSFFAWFSPKILCVFIQSILLPNFHCPLYLGIPQFAYGKRKEQGEESSCGIFFGATLGPFSLPGILVPRTSVSVSGISVAQEQFYYIGRPGGAPFS